MTSPANQQNPIPATTTPATTATSYASAAGAPKKPAQAPLVATGSSPAQNAKGASSTSPVNGKPAVTPAIPAVARGSSNLNGSDHARKSSVTMAANGPNSYVANGGPVGGAKSGIQFGFDSPAMGHSTPQAGSAAPIPIPGGNARVPSPAHSPSPIPQPSASGGRPPSSLQQPTNQMTFGSLGSDGERHMRQGSVPNPNSLGSQPGSHFRRESGHSIDTTRPNFQPQGGRGRGFNPHNNFNNPQMGFPPNNQFRNGPGQGRGMPPAFQPQPRNVPYPNSPQPARSPALVPSMPNTPNMPPAAMQPSPMQQNAMMQTPPNYHYGPPVGVQHQQNFGYPPQQLDYQGRPMQMPYGYSNMQYMAPPQANSPGFNPSFVPPPHYQQSHSMSRTPSQPERPASATQSTPVIASSTPQTQHAQVKTGNFVKPGRKSAAIQIKTLAGEVVDTSTFKAPASPGPSINQSRTPPIATSTPPPPPKSTTPSHGRTESHAAPKTAKQIQDELKEKIKQATQKAAEPKEEKAKAEEPVAKPAEKAAEKPAEKPVEKAVEKPAEKPVEKVAEKVAEPKAEATPEAKAEPAAKPAETKAAEPVKAEEPAKKEEKAAEPEKPAETEEEEMERIIREMEEADAKREAEEAIMNKKREAEKAAAKIKAEEDRIKNAADEDAKLREQEREMERLEEEKEKRAREGKTLSVAEALAQARSGKDADKVDSVTDKLAGMKIDSEKAGESAGQKSAAAEKRHGKPAALNLAPLKTSTVEPPQPSAALQSLKSARFLKVIDQDIYPEGIKSPNPALNAAVSNKGKTFKYDATFLLQFKTVYTDSPSVEFHQQVKSLIGDGDRSASSRGGNTPARQNSRAGAGFVMGSFGAPPGRTLPAGSTSADRFAASNSKGPVNPMASFQRPGGAFPSSTSMSRTSSHQNLPNSPRQSSRNTRGSRRNNDFNAAKEAQAAKNMPLTAGMDLKPIAVTATGWKASSLGKAGPAASTVSGYLDPEMVQRKVKAALNKMTPEKFDKIADQILLIASQSKDESDGRTLRQVIQLTFEKATDEAHWASMYAKFCKRMLETMSPDIRDERIKDKNGAIVSGGNLFRKYLLNRCQEEFERGWVVNLPEQPAEEVEGVKKTAEAALLSDEYYIAAAAKRRGLGLVQFIGELFKLGMLTERIMHECVHKLVDYKGVPDEAEVESLSKLLRTIGANLDTTDKGRPLMDAYFSRIMTMVEMPDLPSRLKFMLMDVVDLRRSGWRSKEANKGPKTLEEVRAEAEAAQAAKAQENARTNSRGGRMPSGRGDNRQFSSGYQQQVSNQVGMDDLRRLKGSANRTSSGNISLGPTSMFSSRSNSGRRMGPGGSLGRAGDDSGPASRTGTPPTQNIPHSNAFSLLANMDNDHPASPPSASASPALSKAVPDSDKKESE